MNAVNQVEVSMVVSFDVKIGDTTYPFKEVSSWNGMVELHNKELGSLIIEDPRPAGDGSLSDTLRGIFGAFFDARDGENGGKMLRIHKASGMILNRISHFQG